MAGGRPNMVRADTIDLQDQDAPTAADHQKHIEADSIAPHQAAQFQHVQEERRSEEETLADAWNMAGQHGNEQAANGNGKAEGDAAEKKVDATNAEADDGSDDEDDDDDMMDRMSSSPSIEDEDIDFEFVYALHTFVATVEGQANATKGDTMVLLDDSNSYWWLVRVVKDSSIGYLPAEHIETPTERLARLNKHRNIDLSQTMLGDNPEKTRNPLKKAMRRRTAKTVQFAAPTYVEASDYDYSTEDEDGMIDPYGSTMESQNEQMSDRGAPAEVEERNAPEEANVHATRRFSGESFTNGKASLDSSKASMDSKRSSIDDPQLSPKLFDRSEAAPLKSRKGTPRNADSFLKDEGMETRKISLTPGLLRDDTVSKASSTESTRTDSFESLVKTPSPQEERSKRDSKDKKKDKKPEKKQGMLSGLFKSKKKDKKFAARDEGELSDMEKVSAEMSRGSSQGTPAAVAAGNVSPVERMTQGPMSAENRAQARAKLQKPQPPDQSRVMSPIEEPAQQAPQHYYQAPGGFVAELEGDQVAYEMATGQEHNMPVQQAEPEVATPVVQEKTSSLSPIANMLRSGSTSGEPKPKKAKRSKQRVELDDFDEPEEDEQGPNPFLEQEQRSRQASQESDRLSASPVEILSPSANTFMHGTESIHIPQMDTDSDEEEEDEEVSAKSSDSHSTSTDPSFVEKPSEQQQQQPLERPSAQRENTQALMSGMPGYMPPPTPTEETPNPISAPSSSTTTPTPTTTSREKELPSEDNDLTPTLSPQPALQTQPQTHAQTPSTTSLSSTSSSPTATATPETPISSSPQQPTTTSFQPQTHREQEWDDANLRAWFDADDVKDMLAIIHHSKDDHGIDGKSAAVEHPSMQGLYADERKGIEGMMGELDGLLGGLLRRRGVVFN